LKQINFSLFEGSGNVSVPIVDGRLHYN